VVAVLPLELLPFVHYLCTMPNALPPVAYPSLPALARPAPRRVSTDTLISRLLPADTNHLEAQAPLEGRFRFQAIDPFHFQATFKAFL
jgi:hypothetical protein